MSTDRLNEWLKPNLQAASYVRHVRWTCYNSIRRSISLLNKYTGKNTKKKSADFVRVRSGYFCSLVLLLAVRVI